MDDKKIENTFKDIMGGILAGVSSETEKNYPEMIEAVDKYADNPEDFDILFRYPLGNVLEAAFRRRGYQNIGKVSFIFMQYNLLDHNIVKLCIRFEGMACSADKSRHIMRSYLKYYGEGKPIDLVKTEKVYWMPQFFTAEQWIKYFEAFYDLFYGSPQKYLEFMVTDFKELSTPPQSKEE